MTLMFVHIKNILFHKIIRNSYVLEKNVLSQALRNALNPNRLMSSSMFEDVHLRQLFDRVSCTYTYLLADKISDEAILIDPVIELVERDVTLVRQMGLKLKYAINTHAHADHITGSGMLKCLIPQLQSVISEDAGALADIKVKNGDIIEYGNQKLEVRATPGHTNGCVTYVDHRHCFAFTGDALLIRGCGRTDFQEGSSERLYENVHSQILSLPEHYIIYPAHDYNGHMMSTVAEEKKFNPRLTKSKEEFIKIMDGLGLPYPDKIDISLPANKVCGLYNLPEELVKMLEEAKLQTSKKQF